MEFMTFTTVNTEEAQGRSQPDVLHYLLNHCIKKVF